MSNTDAEEAGAGQVAVVLIVDDEPLGREVLRAALRPLGCDVLTATSGNEALERAEAVLPDVVLLDVLMPGMDGIEVCRRIRSNDRLREVPVLMVTALDDRDSRLAALSAGADDFLSKPADNEEVRARVRTIVRLNRYRRLRDEAERARDYARRLVDAEEGERRRIARELHDQVGQQLIAVKFSLGQLTSSLPESLHRDAAGLDLLVDEAIEQVREVSRALRPSLLDDFGLVPALELLAMRLRNTAGYEVVISSPGRCPRLDPAVEVCCFRIAQEAVTNAMRHSGARRVVVRIGIRGADLKMAVRDTGAGFDVAAALSAADHGRSLGLISMRERAGLCGGRVSITSASGKGTIVLAQFPAGAAVEHVAGAPAHSSE